MNRITRREAISLAGLGLLSCGAPEQPETQAPAEELDLNAWIQPVPRTSMLLEPGYYVWGGSVVQSNDGLYHMLYSRWPMEHGFNAWVTHSEVARAVSDSPIGPFKHADVALPERGPEHWDGHCTHNPTAYRFGDKYYLYYTGNHGDRERTKGLNWSHRNHQRIGVAIADSPEGPWERLDAPVIDVSPEKDAPDSLMAANAAATLRPDGSVLLVYKCVSQQRPLPFGGPVTHLAATAPAPTGPFTKNLNPIFTAEGDDFPAEDSYIWHDAKRGRYFAVLKDQKGAFTGIYRSLALFESPDGFAWKSAANPLVTEKQIPWADTGVTPVFRMERPQLWFENGEPAVLYCSVMQTDLAEDDRETYNVHIPLRRPVKNS